MTKALRVNPLLSKLQGVPKKRWIGVQQAVEGIRSDLRIKVGGVLENSGYFLSNEYKNSSLL